MAQSATLATQNPTSRHNRGTASQLRKRARVTDEEDFRVTDEGLSVEVVALLVQGNWTTKASRRKQPRPGRPVVFQMRPGQETVIHNF